MSAQLLHLVQIMRQYFVAQCAGLTAAMFPAHPTVSASSSLEWKKRCFSISKNLETLHGFVGENPVYEKDKPYGTQNGIAHRNS